MAADTSVAEKLHAIAAPLREALEQVDAELAEKMIDVERLRADRSQLRQALRLIDPTYEPRAKPGPKPKSNARGVHVGKPTVDAVTEQLRRLTAAGELNGGGITATELARRDDWPQSQSQTSAALAVLHDRGVVRLDHTGTGGGKWYALVQ